MYLMVLVLIVGMFPCDHCLVRYVLPMAIVGLSLLGLLRLYTESLLPCDKRDVSCSDIYFERFRVVAMSMMSTIAFSMIIFWLVLLKSRNLQ